MYRWLVSCAVAVLIVLYLRVNTWSSMTLYALISNISIFFENVNPPGVEGSQQGEDKRKAVQALLQENEEGNRGWSNVQIATYCKVSHTLVQNIKKEREEGEIAFLRNKDHDGSLSNGEHPASEDDSD